MHHVNGTDLLVIIDPVVLTWYASEESLSYVLGVIFKCSGVDCKIVLASSSGVDTEFNSDDIYPRYWLVLVTRALMLSMIE